MSLIPMAHRRRAQQVAAVLFAQIALFGSLPCRLMAESGDAERFDKSVAPVLARHCLDCHNTSSKKGGLDLSQRDSALAGGESGIAIVPGKAADSPMWQYVESDEMPKDRPRLSPEEKMVLRQWIDSGATWGSATIDPFAYSSEQRAGYDWWSLQRVACPSPPTVKDQRWPANDVDRFVLARLESEGLQPAPRADRRTLVRRLYFDLIGLPPEPEVVQRFARDTSPQAYEKLVDQLLGSPHYGERWARHWLDVVRFGETQGFERNKIRENAWRYRDWVINSLNRDLPYDEFVRQQIAGDALYPGDLDALIATGYHVCGTWDQVAHLEGSAMMKVAARQDHLEDLVATLGQAFLGVTINCGRCHDHKFDPITQQDYYQIVALLAGVNQQEKEREIAASRDKPRETQLIQRIGDLDAELSLLETQLRDKYQSTNGGGEQIEGLRAVFRFTDPPASQIADESATAPSFSLVAGKPARYSTEDPPQRLIAALKESGEFTLEAWITPAKKTQTGPARIVTLSRNSGERNFTLGQDGDRFDFRLRTTKTDQNGIPSLASPAGTVQPQKTHVVFSFDHEGMGRLYLNGQRVAERKIGGNLSNWDEEFHLGLGDELSGERRWDGAFHFVAVYSRALDHDQIRRNFGNESKDIRAREAMEAILARATQAERARYGSLSTQQDRLREELDQVSYAGPAHVIVPSQPPVFHVLLRGDFRNPGPVVVPAGLAAFSRVGLPGDFGLTSESSDSERRIKLAEWLTDRRNPLTARVLVNRLWHYHFGTGIVDTPSDLGYAGGRPSHPELLDYLAARFMQRGWSIKDVQRLIVTSETYRQASTVTNASADAIDTDNRLLWRFNTRRLEGEAMRDSVLAVSGSLNGQIGGPSYQDLKVSGGQMGTNAEFTDPTGEFHAGVNRRTIYRLWARSGNNPLLESLDCPDPSVMSPKRTRTITPVQALSLLNNSLMESAASRFAERVRETAGDGDVSAQIRRAYLLALARSPSEKECLLADEFVSQYGLEQLCLVLFNANEFLFVN